MRAGNSSLSSRPPSITMKWQAKPNLLIKNRRLSVVISQWRAAIKLSLVPLKGQLIRPSRRRKMTKQERQALLLRATRRQPSRLGARRRPLRLRIAQPRLLVDLIELLLPEICHNHRPLLVDTVNLPSKTPLLPPKRWQIMRKRVDRGTRAGPAAALQIIKVCQI